MSYLKIPGILVPCSLPGSSMNGFTRNEDYIFPFREDVFIGIGPHAGYVYVREILFKLSPYGTGTVRIHMPRETNPTLFTLQSGLINDKPFFSNSSRNQYFYYSVRCGGYVLSSSVIGDPQEIVTTANNVTTYSGDFFYSLEGSVLKGRGRNHGQPDLPFAVLSDGWQADGTPFGNASGPAPFPSFVHTSSWNKTKNVYIGEVATWR